MKERELNEKIFDQILKYTAEKQVENIANEFFDNELEPEISYSSGFVKEMNNFFRKNRRKDRTIHIKRIILKSAVAIFIFLIISVAVIFNVEALRVPFLNFFEHPGQQSTKIETKDQNTNYDLFVDQIHGMYLPAYLPDSYSIQSIDKTGQNTIAIFKKYDNRIINFQNIPEGTIANIDNENAQTEHISVNGEDAQLFIKNDKYTLVFRFENNVYMLSGTISKNDILKVAGSLIFYK
jgi:hypothetical protein